MQKFRDLGIVLLIVGLATWTSLSAQSPNPEVYQDLQFRHIGPKGNRVLAVAGIPGDPNILYAGAATGGLFKSYDGGVHWEPIFDDQNVASIGALAVAPSDSNIVWVGTGEPFIRPKVSIGNGIYCSTDGGKTWQHMGLEESGRIARIVIHPTNPDIVYAAAIGHAYGPQQQRGLFRTSDGGKTWQRVLSKDEHTGAVDIVMDPSNPRILFAALWQLLIQTSGSQSGGPGSGLYKSSDGGDSWRELKGNGLPDQPYGRIGLAIAPSQPQRVYALIESAKPGSLWRSEDSGENWKLISRNPELNARANYYSRMAVLPDNPNEVYFLTGLFLDMSIDGGATDREVKEVWPDNHDMWIDPLNANRLVVANDRYVNISTNRGKSWMRSGLPAAQMYHVATDNQIPYYVYGNRQDGPAHRGPSNSLNGRYILPADWTWAGGSESGFTYPDPADTNMVWTSGQNGFLQHLDLRTGLARSVNPWPDASGRPLGDQKYRMHWTTPIALSPHDPNRIYVGSQYVHESDDGGQTWQVISPDLTTNDPKMRAPKGLLGDNYEGVSFYMREVVFAIAESPLEAGVIWAGTNDGLVQVTRNGGKSWSNVTGNIPGLPPWGTVNNIEPSHHKAGTAYVSIDLHQANDRNPYVFRTSDYGQNWTNISSDLPRSVFSYVNFVGEDPVRPGLLYLGLENALFVSFDDGGHWLELQNNLPHVPVSWITVQQHFDDLVLSTYGRGFWILDDITPLQQLNDSVLASQVHLFEPRAAYRFLTRPTLPMHMGEATDPSSLAGDNPPYGASLNYYLRESQENVKILITNASGETIRSLDGTGKKGMNRLWWDLRYEGSRRPGSVEAPGDPVVFGASQLAPLVPPGDYTVKLQAGGMEQTGTLTVRKDPHSPGTLEGIQAQTKLLLQLRELLNSAADAQNQIDTLRGGLKQVKSVLKGDQFNDLREKIQNLDEQLEGISREFYRERMSGLGQESGLSSKIMRLAGGIAESDFQPTAAQAEVAELYSDTVSQQLERLRGVLSGDVARLNQELTRRGIPYVGSPR